MTSLHPSDFTVSLKARISRSGSEFWRSTCFASAKLADLGAAASSQRAAHRSHHVVEIEGLVGDVVGANPHRFDGGFGRCERRQEHHQDVLAAILDSRSTETPSVSGSLKLSRTRSTPSRTCSMVPRARLRLEDLIALALEPPGQRPADQGLRHRQREWLALVYSRVDCTKRTSASCCNCRRFALLQ